MSGLNKTKKSKTNLSVYASVTIAVVCSIVLVLIGIWNAQRTAEIAESSIKTSIDVQQLSAALRTHQDSMSYSIEAAVTNAEAHWRINYESSLLQLQQAIHNSSLSISDPIVSRIQDQINSVIQTERKFFELIGKGNSDLAFSLWASDSYQDKKIEQERLALTLRAILDKKAKDVIAKLYERLNQTTIALILQIVLIVTVWFYIVAVIRKWQKSQSQHSQELSRLAHYDTLTGIGNRALFQLRLEAAFQHSRRKGKSVGLLLMDIDHFKDINDSLGHDIGDELLITVAAELRRTCREEDTVVRLGGDEFAIIVTELDKKNDTALLSNKILSIFQNPVILNQHEIKTGTSIGIAFYPTDADSAEELLRKADMALYEAKRNGRANYKLFNSEIETLARKKVQIQEDLRTAIKEDQFELYYQPIIDLSGDDVPGCECLIRWIHPERGLIPPDEFIHIAEESRLIVPIGKWVLETACMQQVSWQNEGLPSLSVAVNLSGVQFNERDLLEMVDDILRTSGIPRKQLTLEITESTLMQTDGDVISKLHSLNALGVKLAIDDFGTGYSSLAYLKRFPIHHLKIDREFVKDLPNNTHDIAISRSIIKMAHELGISVVAEGIEDTAQLNFLNEANCNFGQGYYFGKPMPAKDFKHWVQQTQDSSSNLRMIKG